MRQRAGARALLAQREALMHAEAVLLVDDHQAEARELHRLLEQRVGAHDQLDLAAGHGIRAHCGACAPAAIP